MKKTNFYWIFLFVAALFLNACDDETLNTIEVGGEITTNTTYESGKTYVVNDMIYVTDGKKLEIEPGTTLKFKSGAGITVRGSNSSFVAQGTADKPITFTSASGTPKAGDWSYLDFQQGANNCIMAYCTVEYAGSNADWGEINLTGNPTVSISNCTIRNSAAFGICLDENSLFTAFTANTVSNTAKNPILVYAKNVHSISSGNTLSAPENGGIEVHQGNITGAVTWKKLSVPYIIFDNFYVASANNSSLTIEAGTKLKFKPGTSLFVGDGTNRGTLKAIGTADAPIVFTSNSASPKAGDWNYLDFNGTATNCELKYCTIEYGGADENWGEVCLAEGAQVAIDYCTIKNSASMGIHFADKASAKSLTNNTFSTFGKSPIRINAIKLKDIGVGNVFAASDRIFVEAGNMLETSMTWPALSCPYLFTERIYVGNGATLTISAGAQLLFNANTSIIVGGGSAGKLIATGTAASPILFSTSISPKAKGTWEGIYFEDNIITGSKLEYCTVEYGGQDTNWPGNISIDGTSNFVTLKNCTIKSSLNYGIVKYNSATYINGGGNTFSDNQTNEVSL
jgi:hypothetical protein